ncbi:MAG TPA: phage holin family protein [Candidatus Binataceae bacterium]|jgi:hypothetical protein
MSSQERNLTPNSVNGTAADWTVLFGRMVDDLSRIIEAEIKLFQAGLRPALSGAVDRAIAALVLVLSMAAGSVCLLTAFIILLHQWLPWWQAFAIGGGVAIAIGFIAYLLTASITRRAVTQTASASA